MQNFSVVQRLITNHPPTHAITLKPFLFITKPLAECASLIRRFKSMNSINTATSMATSINSIHSEENQNDLDEDDFVIVETTRL